VLQVNEWMACSNHITAMRILDGVGLACCGGASARAAADAPRWLNTRARPYVQHCELHPAGPLAYTGSFFA
jgi:hypothetical protein